MFELQVLHLIFLETAIWAMVLCVVDLTLGKFGPHPGGSYGGQGGLSFYVGAKGR